MTKKEKFSIAYDSISDAIDALDGIVGENFMKRLEEIQDAISREEWTSETFEFKRKK